MNALQALPLDGRITPVPWIEGQDAARFHEELSLLQRARLSPTMSSPELEDELRRDAQSRRMEFAFVEQQRHMISQLASEAPTTAAEFVAWFDGLRDCGPGQGDLLLPWLAESASRDEMRWILAQELAGEAGVADLVALTQIGLPARAKLALARNYWDEMGEGSLACMHGPMLAETAKLLTLHEASPEPCWETVARRNLMVALASHRRWVWQSVGALGVMELTAPERASWVNLGLRRLEVPGAARRYFAMHASDGKHVATWNAEAIVPIAEELPGALRAMAEGALMRLLQNQQCFNRYRTQLGLPE